MSGNDPKQPLGEEQQRALIVNLREELGEEVDAKLRNHGEEGLTDKCLRRWLVARKWKLADAKSSLASHAAWRADFMPAGHISEEQVARSIAHNKTSLQGLDKGGRPVVILLVERHIAKDLDFIEAKRFIAYTLDTCIKYTELHNPDWDGKCTTVFDLSGMTMANYDVSALRAVFDLLQNHYPERLHRLYLYCAPFLFYGLWKIVSPFVDPVTKTKVVFLYRENAPSVFEQEFDKDVLIPELGGTGEWKPIQKQWDTIREKEAQRAAEQQKQ
mmetsp:Transcript_25556/g.55666  ORF Transcript_25556/g.55666 Transcript_25556/m.55666 type:complete len:272 (+) Transcript_25556:98-913(+)|eukprot:CAMPEP_0202924144 /NCGR_PEP_ID=MMETSP1392-20130828/78820_1 /ASSEMBLY_ACC=CAM_ASM_000868 /TAXON_ID=225041 /ORGANISM="Chlamydomonas chlamydogama, Strain SAG 11-48b" /LENGTH=271 /DNA_ID=CAMNT_0049617859 /DNA_START=35 /DNA_END=850 /DNA_ORIENTATION=+